MEANDIKAMREALEFIKLASDDYEKYGNTKAGALDMIYEKACAALAAPSRNCDRFADAETARQAWLDDAENWDDFGSPRLELHEWLFALGERKDGP